MPGYTSDYSGVAHGAPNWDAQLRNDFGRLVAYLQESSWTPAYGGGSGATLGTGGIATGYAAKVGSIAYYFGQFVYGSSAVVGDASVASVNLFGSNVNQTFAAGTGWYKPINGANPRRKLFFIPNSASSFQILIETSTGLSPLSGTIPSATQSDEIRFQLTVPLA